MHLIDIRYIVADLVHLYLESISIKSMKDWVWIISKLHVTVSDKLGRRYGSIHKSGKSYESREIHNRRCIIYWDNEDESKSYGTK